MFQYHRLGVSRHQTGTQIHITHEKWRVQRLGSTPSRCLFQRGPFGTTQGTKCRKFLLLFSPWFDTNFSTRQKGIGPTGKDGIGSSKRMSSLHLHRHHKSSQHRALISRVLSILRVVVFRVLSLGPLQIRSRHRSAPCSSMAILTHCRAPLALPQHIFKWGNHKQTDSIRRTTHASSGPCGSGLGWMANRQVAAASSRCCGVTPYRRLSQSWKAYVLAIFNDVVAWIVASTRSQQ
ncbi:hypothetical protein BDV30DRAFT_99658 [Aspergillus minisclerotigenes]|uniref:Uncharacterized protein n=1 Tax=Aspergillus minisclerotigenes TaxID=656917 RepID=A0A5N6J4Y6_9EURO|nr:hypothetical protein BDV30DRAFT_99658 [Aspergillus minisclerotigenes]